MFPARNGPHGAQVMEQQWEIQSRCSGMSKERRGLLPFKPAQKAFLVPFSSQLLPLPPVQGDKCLPRPDVRWGRELMWTKRNPAPKREGFFSDQFWREKSPVPQFLILRAG